MEALNREAIVALGNNILNWARPAGWPASPMAVRIVENGDASQLNNVM